jgi:hypothetical protein
MDKMGKREYRQPDGSLSAVRPPRNPYTVATRKAWASLVAEAARQTDVELTTTGKSYRLGIGVSWTDHKKYLAQLGIEVRHPLCFQTGVFTAQRDGARRNIERQRFERGLQ